MSASSELFTWAVRSDVGRVREINQDSASAAPHLFVVADGMGGHRGGEVASAVAVEAMARNVVDVTTIDGLIDGVRQANAEVIERAAADPDLAGMGTTLCVVGLLEADWRGGTRLGLVNVGDSRIYRFADDQLEQLSDDHSLVASLVREGHLTAEEAARHPQRNVVTRALGITDDVEIDYWELPARRGEQFLLCSDGLVDEVNDNQIAAAFRRLVDPGEVVDELVRLANEAGARDNVTVLIVRVDAGGDGPIEQVPPASTHAATGAAERPADPGVIEPLDTRDDPAAVERDGPGDTAASRGRIVGLLTAKVLVPVGVVVAILLGAIALIGSYARNNYFVGFDQDQVVVYQGRPDGVLWFDPTIEDQSALLRDDLTPALELEVEANPEFDDIDVANGYIDQLAVRLAEAGDPAE